MPSLASALRFQILLLCREAYCRSVDSRGVIGNSTTAARAAPAALHPHGGRASPQQQGFSTDPGSRRKPRDNADDISNNVTGRSVFRTPLRVLHAANKRKDGGLALEPPGNRVFVKLGDASRTLVSKMKTSLVLGKRSDRAAPTATHNRTETESDDDFPPPEPLDTARHWMILAGTTIGLFLLDSIWLRHICRSFRGHVVALSVWVLIATLYSTTLYGLHGASATFMWWEGYLLDWLLSFNNLFAFHLIFKSYRTPPGLRLTALSHWIVGAIFCRLALFKLIAEIMSAVAWFRFVGGAFLVYSAVAVVRDEEDAHCAAYEAGEDIPGVSLLKSIVGNRFTCLYDESGSWLIRQSGTIRFGLLPLVVVMLLIVDTLCALDSVSAKVAQIPSEYIACSSSLLAMFGMRSLFFVIEDMVQEFELLKYGIAIILVFIGVQLVVTGWIEISALVSLEVIGFVFVGSVVVSVLRGKKLAAARGSKMTQEPNASKTMRD